jgi:hypothetical protein
MPLNRKQAHETLDPRKTALSTPLPSPGRPAKQQPGLRGACGGPATECACAQEIQDQVEEYERWDGMA